MKDIKEFYKTVFILVIPLAIQNLINVGVSSTDVIVMGKVGEKALSGVSLGSQIQFIMVLIFFGLTSGSSVLTAQYWGKGDIKTIEKVLAIALKWSFAIGLTFTIITHLFPAQLMGAFTNDPEVIREGARYLKIVSLSYVLTAITMVYLNTMRSMERVLISTFVYFCSLLVNLILNIVFVFGLMGLPRMGTFGSGLATFIARCLELIIVIIYNRKFNKIFHFQLSSLLKKDAVIMKDFIKFSLPVILNELMWGAGVSMNAAVLGHMGSAVTAANSAAQVARQLATVVAFGIASAAAILIGKALGEKKEEVARIYAKRLLTLNFFVSLIGAAIVLMVRPVALEALNLTPEAKGYLSFMMFVMSYFVIGQAYNTIMIVGIFRAGGDTKFGLILDISTMWGCSILFGALAAFVFKWSVPIVYIILMSDEILKIPFSTWRYRTYKWLNNVTR